MHTMKNGSRHLRDGITVTHLQSDDGASAVVADHGAHLLSWRPAGGDEALFLSHASGYGGSAAIRGGVPVIFPQFGARGSGQRHGFARNAAWHFLGATLEEGAALAGWTLDAVPDAAGVPADPDRVPGFRLTCTIRLERDTIDIGLTILNTSCRAWRCQAALHTYLRVDALEAVQIDGLQDVPYADQTCPPADAMETVRDAGPLVFEREVDRIYLAAPSQVMLRDGQRRLAVRSRGFPDIVVWNPGQAKAAALADLHPDGHRQFVCIEAAAIGHHIELPPGASWFGAQSLHLLIGKERLIMQE